MSSGPLGTPDLSAGTPGRWEGRTAMPVLRSRIGRGSLTRLVTAGGRSRMIAAANRSCAASERSGPTSRARPSQLTQSMAITVTIAGGNHQNRISTRPMMPM